MTKDIIKTYFPFESRYKKILFFTLPFVVLLTLFFFIYKQPVDLVYESTIENGATGCTVYDDKNNGGNSVCKKINDEGNGIAYEYIIKKGYEYPYSGISFYSVKSEFIDISSYDFIKIRIAASQGKRLPIAFHTYIDNYTRLNDFNTLKNNQFLLHVTEEPQEIRIKLSDLNTPEWWYSVNQTLENPEIHSNFAKVKSINITNCKMLDEGVKDLVIIEEISFHVDLFPFYLFSAIFLPLYFIGGIFLVGKKGEKKMEVNFVYEKTETVNQFEKEEKAVFDFLTSNYHRSDLTITEVQNETGLYEQKISSIIRNRTGMNFKQFLNKLRISEAKRLLRESDLQISEVAFKVGYGNVSHFNRVFKDLENCSPNEYRKQPELTISRN